jgi:hypothetical protein
MKYLTIYSIAELENIIRKHKQKDNLMIWFDLDETLVKSSDDQYTDVLIEPEETQALFDYIHQENILYSFITARFHDTVCNKNKRKLSEMNENILDTIYPFLTKLGIDISEFENEETPYIIKAKNGRCVGVIYKGIIFTGLKGPAIKHYSEKSDLDKRLHIFIDDNDIYLNSVARNVDNCLVIKRLS